MPLCHQPGFKWDGQPVGKETKLDENDVYVTGSNPDVAILVGPAPTLLQSNGLITGVPDSTQYIRMDPTQSPSPCRPVCGGNRRYSLCAGLVSLISSNMILPAPSSLSDCHISSFDGEVLSSNLGADFDMNAFMARHSKDIRYPEILSCAIALKRNCGYKKLGAMGFCYGGWAVFRLGAEGSRKFS